MIISEGYFYHIKDEYFTTAGESTLTDANCVTTDRLIGIALPTRRQLSPFLFPYLYIYP